jgi:hypothetical protein
MARLLIWRAVLSPNMGYPIFGVYTGIYYFPLFYDGSTLLHYIKIWLFMKIIFLSYVLDDAIKETENAE